jgi:hypothetical protein
LFLIGSERRCNNFKKVDWNSRKRAANQTKRIDGLSVTKRAGVLFKINAY